MAESSQERTEAPTPHRLAEARREGNIARSADLTAAVSLLVAVLLLHLFGRHVFEGMTRAIQMSFERLSSPRADEAADVTTMLIETMMLVAWIAGPIVVGLTAVTLLATIGQVGFNLTTKPLEPDLQKLNPIKGLANLVNLRAGVRLIMSLAKVIVIGSVAAVAILDDLPSILGLIHLEAVSMVRAASELVFMLSLKLAAALLVLALLDFAYQKWQRFEDLRMTKQDLREEMKRMEGDPFIRQRRTRIARQIALQRIAAAVPKADVIVTNPTHFAVALRYDASTMTAPKVIAKGADYLALRIRQLAATHGVPIVERKELARALYAGVEVGQEVPAEYYHTVAEILAYVYRLAGRATA